jgi:hypothetical protein
MHEERRMLTPININIPKFILVLHIQCSSLRLAHSFILNNEGWKLYSNLLVWNIHEVDTNMLTP